MKLTPNDINGLIGILPTPSTDDASNWHAQNTVDLPETSRMCGLMVDAGVDFLLTNGTFGECATLTEAEHLDFNRCVIDSLRGKIPLFAGIGTLNTRDTVRRARALVDAGADGVFVARPMWLALDQDQIFRFYGDVAEALPGTPIMMYDNPTAFKGPIARETYLALSRIPEIIASKHAGGPGVLDDAIAIGGDHCRLLPLVSDWYRTAHHSPELMTAAWSGHVACAPKPLVALARAIKAHDWDTAKTISDQCVWAESAMFIGKDLADFMNYSIQIGHLRFNHAGLIKAGPPRPPYVGLPPEYAAGGEETGRRWAQLEKQFSA